MRQRTRGKTQNNSSKVGKKQAKKKQKDWMHSGREGRERSEEERNAANARREEALNRPFEPMRFWIKGGETARLVVLDTHISDIRYFYEHNFTLTGDYRDTENVICVDEFETCPVCEGEVTDKSENPSYIMVLSVIDTRGFESQKHGHVSFSRKLLVIKSSLHSKFLEVLDAAEQEYGGIRGVVLDLHRSNDSNAARTGEPKIVAGGKLYSKVSEDRIKERFQHAAILNKKDEIVVKTNEQQEPFDYLEIFPKPTANNIRSRFGLTVDNSQSSNEQFEDDSINDDDLLSDDDSDIPFETEDERNNSSENDGDDLI